jgi:hypothetical protein
MTVPRLVISAATMTPNALMSATTAASESWMDTDGHSSNALPDSRTEGRGVAQPLGVVPVVCEVAHVSYRA